MNTFFTARLSPLPIALECGTEQKADSSGGSPTDEVLLRRLQVGEQEALGLLYQRFSRVIRSIGVRILKDSSEAEDLVQELFLFLQRKCALFDSSKSTARSWIIQMAYCRAFERRRYLTARRFYSRTDIESSSHHLVGTPTRECDYSAEAVFGRNGLSQVLRSLSPDQRETLRLHFFEGYTFAEISKKMGQSFGNVRNHYYRGLDKMRRQMIKNSVPAGQSNGE